MSATAKDLLTLAPQGQAAALLAFMVNPTSARDRSAWLELQDDLPDAQAVFDAVQSLRHDERMPMWEKLAGALSQAPLETRQELVSDARELLRVGGRVSMLRKLLWVCQRHLLNGKTATANTAADADAALPERLDITHALAACCFAAWISESVPKPELTLDLSEASTLNDQWWQAVTAPWREQHGDTDLRLPRRDKVDGDLALRSLRVLQELPPHHAAALLEQWVNAALEVAPPDTSLHPIAADVLRLTANLLKVGMPPALRQFFDDEPPAVPQAVGTGDPCADEVTAPSGEQPYAAESARAPHGPASTPVQQPANVTPALAAPPRLPLPPQPIAPVEPPAVSPMERPFSAVTRPPEVAFVFKAALLHLPGDPDYPASEEPATPPKDGGK
jgi:hypothetical protein